MIHCAPTLSFYVCLQSPCLSVGWPHSGPTRLVRSSLSTFSSLSAFVVLTPLALARLASATAPRLVVLPLCRAIRPVLVLVLVLPPFTRCWLTAHTLSSCLNFPSFPALSVVGVSLWPSRAVSDGTLAPGLAPPSPALLPSPPRRSASSGIPCLPLPATACYGHCARPPAEAALRAPPSPQAHPARPHAGPSAEPSSSKQRRLTLQDIHIPAGFEIAKGLEEPGSEYPSEENIQRAAEVLQSLRGRMPDGSDGQVAACDYCRRRKIRCDRIKPTCGSCTALGAVSALPKTCCASVAHRQRRSAPSWKPPASSSVVRGLTDAAGRPPPRWGRAPPASSRKRCLRKVKEVAGTRTRANSTNSGENAAAARHRGRCLRPAQRRIQELVDGDAQHRHPLSQSVCRLARLFAVGHLGTRHVPHRRSLPSAPNNSAQWDNMWGCLWCGSEEQAQCDQPGLGRAAQPERLCMQRQRRQQGRSFPFTACLVRCGCARLVCVKHLAFAVSDAVPGRCSCAMQNAMPMGAPSTPQVMAPQMHQEQPFMSSQSSMAAEAIAFQSAMGHFFPKSNPLSSSLSQSSSTATAEANTPTEIDQFISMVEPNHVHHQEPFQQHPAPVQHRHPLRVLMPRLNFSHRTEGACILYLYS
ncbi:hypothetical protein L1887_60799 [Cichorium endivia]|nr:hypothetical protein L1887_60799 [Cichorium endivia]